MITQAQCPLPAPYAQKGLFPATRSSRILGLAIGSIAALVMCLTILTGCRVQLVAPYDEELLKQTVEVSQQVDKMYLTMAASGEEEVEYEGYKATYVDVEVLLRSIVVQNKARVKNEETSSIANSCLQQWIEYAKSHRERKLLVQQEIELNRMTMADLLHALYAAERVKSKVKDE